MADRLVTIAKFADDMQAHLTQQMLADNGIESVLSAENAATLAPGFGAILLLVMADNAAGAKELIEAQPQPLEDLADDAREADDGEQERGQEGQ